MSDVIVLLQSSVQSLPLLLVILSLQVRQAELLHLAPQTLGLGQELTRLDPGAGLLHQHQHPLLHAEQHLLELDDCLHDCCVTVRLRPVTWLSESTGVTHPSHRSLSHLSEPTQSVLAGDIYFYPAPRTSFHRITLSLRIFLKIISN